MDRQLAERMVGAACILAVLVLVVPAILDGNPDSGTIITHPDVDNDLDLRTHTILLDGAGREPPVPTARQVEAAPEPGQPGAEVPSPTLELPTPTPSAAPPAVKAPVASPAVPAPVAVKPTPPVKNAATGDWFVQLGSFSRKDNADRLAADLKSKGFSASVEGGGGSSGTLFRVRAGPAADRPAAEALAVSLARSGFKDGRVGRQ